MVAADNMNTHLSFRVVHVLALECCMERGFRGLFWARSSELFVYAGDMPIAGPCHRKQTRPLPFATTGPKAQGTFVAALDQPYLFSVAICIASIGSSSFFRGDERRAW